MSTDAVICFEGCDSVLSLYSDGYPSFVVPLVKRAYNKAMSPESFFKEFTKLAGMKFESNISVVFRGELTRGDYDHCYMILKDDRLIVDSLDIIKLM